MRLFISSVRAGLEEERDALPGLILALEHEPKRFEDYTAQGRPSREACLRGVEEAGAYLLLLGAQYGDPLPETGLAPTEEEFGVARRRGIPVLVFRKRNVEMDERQGEFAQRVEDYATGKFRKSFDSTSTLLIEVTRAIRELEREGEPLEWRRLPQPPAAPWGVGQEHGWPGSGRPPALELHVMPVGEQPLVPATVLEQMPKRLARTGRDAGLFSEAQGLETGNSGEAAWAATQSRNHREPGAGIIAHRNGAVSVWQELVGDHLGYILDPVDVADRLVVGLRIGRDLLYEPTELSALAVGLSRLSMVVIGSRAELGGRSSASGFLSQQDRPVRVEAEDAVPTSILGAAADEIATELATRILQRARQGGQGGS